MSSGYHVADSLLCLFVFFPSMLCYWRGIWDLYGVYLFPADTLLCDWATFGLGCGAILGYFYQPAVDHLLHRAWLVEGRRSWKGHVVFVLLTRFAFYVHAVTAMAHWRGVWHLANRYIDAVVDQTTGAIAGLIVCYSALVVLRASHTTIFPPFIVINDMRADVLVPSTRLQTKVDEFWHSQSQVGLTTVGLRCTKFIRNKCNATIFFFFQMMCDLDKSRTSAQWHGCATEQELHRRMTDVTLAPWLWVDTKAWGT